MSCATRVRSRVARARSHACRLSCSLRATMPMARYPHVPLLLYKSGLAGGISFSRAYAATTAAGVASEAVAAVARLRVASRALLGRRAEEERARRRPHHCCRVAGAAHSGRYGLEHAPTSSARRRRPEELRVHRCQQREMNTMLLC